MLGLDKFTDTRANADPSVVHTAVDKSWAQSIATESAHFLCGAAYGLMQAPADGIQQLVSQESENASPLHIVDAPADGDKFGQAGRLVGSAVEFWLVNAAVGKLSGIGKLRAISTASREAIKMGLTGAAVAAATPVTESDHFGLRKGAAIIEAVGAYSTFGAINGKVNSMGLLGRAGFRSYLNDGLIYGLSGTASGLVGSELHAGLTQQRPASLEELGVGAGQNMLLGFALASIDHVMPVKSLKIEPASDGAATSKLSTEKWVADHYDGKTEIRSPILTLLAENTPELRPPNYGELRTRAFAEKNSQDLSLGDWAPEQRVSVVKELRRLSSTKVWTDANIDAFISRFTTPKLVGLVSDFDRTSRPIAQAMTKVEEEVARHPELAKHSPTAISYDKATREALRNAGHGKFLDLVDEANSLRSKGFNPPEQQLMNAELQSQINAISANVGVPKVTFVGYAAEAGQSIDGYMEVGMGRNPAMSAETLERTLHEFNHHIQGPLYGTETLAYVAKYPVYSGLKRLGLANDIPRMQAPNTREEYLKNYIGTTIEVQSYATGLLGRIRALASGLPSENKT
jgi:hypothetical protein